MYVNIMYNIDNKCSGRIQLWVSNDTLDIFSKSNDEHNHASICLQGISPNSNKKNIINIWNNGKSKPNRNLVFA